MKGFNILVVFLVLISVCHGQEPKQKIDEKGIKQNELLVFGNKIIGEGSISSQEMTEKYSNMSVTDTLQIKFNGVVSDVCQAKGCWMKVQLKDGNEAMVRFKDYGFFVPKDITGKEVIVNGFAFVEEMSVEDQRHYAKDGGKSKEEIEKIMDSKKTYGFEADGVILKQ